MRFSRIIIITAATAFVFGCSTENTPTGTGNNGPGPVAYTYVDTAYYQLTFTEVSGYSYGRFPEPVVNWEHSFGEPFTDVNGNGVFDYGIDGFISSQNPDSNQDLNYNNSYDGPDDPWEPGFRFDDIDGNGEFRQNPDNPYVNYEAGLPFADFDLNGQRDTALGFFTALTEFKAYPGLDGGVWYWSGPRPSNVYFGYRFVSDSGVVYDLSDRTFVSIVDIAYFVATDSGLLYYAVPSYNRVAIPLMVLDTGAIQEGVVDDVVVDYPHDPFHDTLTFVKTIDFDTSLEVYQYSFPHIIKISFDAAVMGCDFYLSLERKILGYGQWVYSDPPSNGYRSAYYYYIDSLPKIDSIFIPMTR